MIQLKKRISIEKKAIVILVLMVIVLFTWIVLSTGSHKLDNNGYKAKIDSLESNKAISDDIIKNRIQQYQNREDSLKRLIMADTVIKINHVKNRTSIRVMPTNELDSIVRADIYNRR